VQGEAENEAVRARIRFTALAVATLMVCLAGLAQVTAGAPRTAPGAHSAEPAIPPPPEARIDINHATVDELLKVPGMTRSWAGRIVRFRPYHSRLDLLEKGVVSSQVYDRIKDYVIAHRDRK